MKEVLATISEKKRAFEGLPFFAFLGDDRLAPEERLAFLPCMAHWVMSFADLNKYFLRADPRGDRYQERVNHYSHEDDDHWQLYLEDFRKLGFDRFQTGADWLSFLWGEETRANRLLSYRIARMIMGASSVQKIAIVEAMEEAANVFFPLTVRLAEQFQERTGVELRYLGHFHSDLEAGHTGAGDHEALARIELDEETRRGAVEMVEEIFRLFEDWAEEVLRFALKRSRGAAPAAVRVALPAAA
ncbi:MAG TPA: hypothetical protein VEY09_01650 [Pyrinomonadaceae bacterium]|nr:hypothetical protein [Pyrinomonadaceae bacterium]